MSARPAWVRRLPAISLPRCPRCRVDAELADDVVEVVIGNVVVLARRELVWGELYFGNGNWRLRAVGQGWAIGLAGLAWDYGVDVD